MYTSLTKQPIPIQPGRIAFLVRTSIALREAGYNAQWGVYPAMHVPQGAWLGPYYHGRVLGYNDPKDDSFSDYLVSVQHGGGEVVMDGCQPPQSEKEQLAALQRTRAFAGAQQEANKKALQPLVRRSQHLQWPGMFGHLLNDAHELKGVSNNVKCEDGYFYCKKKGGVPHVTCLLRWQC